MVAALWLRFQGTAYMLLAVVAVLIGAYSMGGRAARRSAETDLLLAEKKIREKANEIDKKLLEMDDDTVLHDSRKWVRGKGRK